MTLTEIKAAYAKGEYESKHVAFLIAGLEAYERDHNFGKCIYENRAIDAEKRLALAEKVVEAANSYKKITTEGVDALLEWGSILHDALNAYDQGKKP